MSDMSNVLEKNFLNWQFGNTEPAVPSVMYIGLSKADPGETGTGIIEPTSGSYARVGITNDTTNWPTIVNGDPKTNGTVITFPNATSTWGTITHIFFSTDSSNGTLIAKGTLNTPKTVSPGDLVTFEIGDISMAAN